ncbi:MAG TPA: flagellin [Bryobacteraceae bacterium]|nr:flagellin [Bryobacteraceae bacterium]
MVSNLSPQSELFLANLNRIEQQLTTANIQMSSGKKLNVASDAPGDVEQLLQLRTDQAKNQQIESNLTLAQTDASAADSALAGAASLIDTAVQLATQGANATQTADTRQSIAQQVEGILNQMVAYSQTQVQGRYIFSGDQNQSPTYQVDLSAANGVPDQNGAANGVDQLSDAAATQQIEDPSGGSFAASETAQQIFDDTNSDGTPAADNVFAALNGLLTSLQNNDQTGISNAISNLQQASARINNAEAFYGTVENRIQDASTFASNYDTQLSSEISDKQDADVTAAAMELSQASTQMQASMQMQGQMPKSTLFDYLG